MNTKVHRKRMNPHNIHGQTLGLTIKREMSIRLSARVDGARNSWAKAPASLALASWHGTHYWLPICALQAVLNAGLTILKTGASRGINISMVLEQIERDVTILAGWFGSVQRRNTLPLWLTNQAIMGVTLALGCMLRCEY
jgi:hypothetical protein